ncbi:glucokinase [Humisphaera borealis]|uniref:Glucokinase n=1 Tax=Humisphaera borealis TaxID=2807512 RepID=A0A7M2X1U0_9BACT|nr:glucokinase [Humisphaera borealis]QOV91726.1 glucokinase [Humisphaera borealis]
MILAGDIGGTNTRLAWCDSPRQLFELREFRSAEYPDLGSIVRKYLQEARPTSPIDRACFGVAGPVHGEMGNRYSPITNLKWTVEQATLAGVLNVPAQRVEVINDLAANAAGIDVLAPDKLLTLQAGKAQPGGRGIISAGTGLGVGGAVWDGKRHIPCPSEGGHYSFGPRNPQECDLLAFLAERETQTFAGYVSWERVLSGPGLYNLFLFHVARNLGTQSIRIPDSLPAGDAATLVSKAAMTGQCERSSMALDLFVSLYGAAAGNVAIQYTAINGLYIGGGIAPKILSRLQGPAFLNAFLDKGPMRHRLLNTVPVTVILDEHCALRGAAAEAARL